MDDLSAATEAAIAAAKHLTPLDDGAVEALRFLARKIDTEMVLRELALEWAEKNKQKPPSVDNVSLPTYLKYCDALGLTPVGRTKMGPAKGAEGGKLAKLRSVQVGKSA